MAFQPGKETQKYTKHAVSVIYTHSYNVSMAFPIISSCVVFDLQLMAPFGEIVGIGKLWEVKPS